MACPRNASMVTRTSSLMLSSLRMATSLCPARGTRPSVCGTCLLANRPAALKITPRLLQAFFLGNFLFLNEDGPALW